MQNGINIQRYSKSISIVYLFFPLVLQYSINTRTNITTTIAIAMGTTDPTMAAVGELFLDCVLLSSTLSVIGCVHRGSLNDEISTGQLLSSLNTVESSRINLPLLTIFCTMISKSLCVSWYVEISALNTVLFDCDWSHNRWSWSIASSSNVQSHSDSMWSNTAAAMDWRCLSLCHNKHVIKQTPYVATIYYSAVVVYQWVYCNMQASLENHNR